MDGLTLLEEARAAGLTVEAEGGRLRIRGPRRAEPIAQRLIAHKDAVLSALTAPPPGTDIRVEDLDSDWRIEWEERAAIREYDGGWHREHAEAAALAEIAERMRRGEQFAAGCPCRACRAATMLDFSPSIAYSEIMGKKRVKLSDQVRQAVDASGLSRYRICKMLGIDQSTMSRFMSGQGGLSMEYLDALADLLNLDIVTGKRSPRAGGRPSKKG